MNKEQCINIQFAIVDSYLKIHDKNITDETKRLIEESKDYILRFLS